MLRMKIYTKTGDDGSTGLIGGQRVAKNDLRIDCFGTVDELNAAIGSAAVLAQGELQTALRRVQNDLFVVGSHMALPADTAAPKNQWMPELSESMVTKLETEIDAAETVLPPLRNFILPGGTELAARLHVARTICRRAERAVVALAREQKIPPIILQYLNRLADWLFVQARLANQIAGAQDTPWEQQR
jgi:cob(I)alamin adenosyltransferase